MDTSAGVIQSPKDSQSLVECVWFLFDQPEHPMSTIFIMDEISIPSSGRFCGKKSVLKVIQFSKSINEDQYCDATIRTGETSPRFTQSLLHYVSDKSSHFKLSYVRSSNSK